MVIYRRKIRLTKCLITHLLLRIRKTLNCSYRLLIRTSLRAVSWVLIYFKFERKKYVFPTELSKNYQQNIKQERQKVYFKVYILHRPHLPPKVNESGHPCIGVVFRRRPYVRSVRMRRFTRRIRRGVRRVFIWERPWSMVSRVWGKGKCVTCLSFSPFFKNKRIS